MSAGAVSRSRDVEANVQSNPSKREEVQRGLKNQITMVALGVILLAITAVIAYFAVTKGLAMQDVAFTSSQRFYAGAMLYIGGSFALASAVNLVVIGARLLYPEKVPADYNSGRMQVAGTIVAPLAAPAALIGLAAMGFCRN